MRALVLPASLVPALLLAACRPDPAPMADRADDAPRPVRIAPPAPVTPEPMAATTAPSHWQCGETLLSATSGAEEMLLAFAGRRLRLPRAESGAPARHADAAGNEFRLHGDTATLVLEGEPPRDCTPGARVSPWNEAAARGVVFRAVGNEPGWLVEVGSGQTPSLQAVLDYGERRLDVARMRSTDSGYRGEATDGGPIVLAIRRGTCRDGMSGEAFEASAELLVGGHRYAGCGAYLTD